MDLQYAKCRILAYIPPRLPELLKFMAEPNTVCSD